MLHACETLLPEEADEREQDRAASALQHYQQQGHHRGQHHAFDIAAFGVVKGIKLDLKRFGKG